MNNTRILLVEDDPDQRLGLAEFLRIHGYEVGEAGSAEEALQMLQRQAFDLMVTDYQLGGATGSWLAGIAARTVQPSPLRALLMTGHDSVADAAGLVVLRKPFDPAQLLAEVRQALAVEPAVALPPPAQRISFTLYVSDSLPSRRTLKKLQAVLEEYEPSQIALTVVDVTAHTAQQAEEHRVVVTPTLVQTFPPPRVWIAGECQDTSVIARLLAHASVEARA